MGVGIFYLPQIGVSNEWQRPADWLSMPNNITSADQIFVGLHAVFESGQNYCAFSFTTSTGQYKVDWGDGNVTLHNSGTIAQKNYDYASISNSTICSRGYKQVIIKVTPVSGNLLTCNFQQRFVTTPAQNQAYSSGFLECILSMPNTISGGSIIFGGGTIRHAYCEKVDIKTIGNATNMTNMFYSCFSLQSVPLFNTQNVTNMQNMFTSCYSLQSVPLFNTINVTNMTYMFQNCYSLQSVPLFNTQNVTIMQNMFYNCTSLQSVPLFNTQNVTNMQSMFSSCISLNFIPNFNTALVTNFTNFANGCNSLDRCITVFRNSVGLQNCQLSKDALVEVFTNLVNRTATTSATIDITGNWGATALTSANRLIATNKKWTITG